MVTNKYTQKKWHTAIKTVAMLHIFAFSFFIIFFTKVPGVNTLSAHKNHSKSIISRIFSLKIAHASSLSLFAPTNYSTSYDNYVTTYSYNYDAVATKTFNYYSNGGAAQAANSIRVYYGPAINSVYG